MFCHLTDTSDNDSAAGKENTDPAIINILLQQFVLQGVFSGDS